MRELKSSNPELMIKFQIMLLKKYFLSKIEKFSNTSKLKSKYTRKGLSKILFYHKGIF